MTDVVNMRVQGDLAFVEINNPPVNASSAAVRAALLDVVHHTNALPLRAVIISGTGSCFMAGGDISEFGQPPILPHLPDVYDAIETANAPWIAAVHGMALGGGFELVMACAFRVAAATAKIGLPEVNVGLVPGAGGTQRLPRLVGVETALDLATTGRMVPADSLTCFDVIVDTDPVQAGVTLAADLPDRPSATSARPVPDFAPDVFEKHRSKLSAKSRGAQAALHNVDAVEWGATLPYALGQPKERALHLNLRDTAESRGLRHAFFAEKSAAKPDAITAATPRDVSRIAVVGGGLMGAGISWACLMAGYDVVLIERDDVAAQAGAKRISDLAQGAVTRGKLTPVQMDGLLARLSATDTYADAAKCDLAIEAVFEDVDVKRDVFRQLAGVMGPQAILATNTSYIDPELIFQNIENPSRCLGLHFFSPAHVMKLLEIIRGPETASDVLATGFALAKRLRKHPVLSGICDGFIGNRILAAYRKQADYMLIDGALPAQIDAAMRAFGMPMGPYELQDLTGLQIAHANRQRQAKTRPAAERYVDIGDRLCELGRTGQRAGAGWYHYADGSRTPQVDPHVTEIVKKASVDAGVQRRDFSNQDITNRILAAMYNEGAMIVEEGIAASEADVDVVKLHGYGFPRFRGGPMCYGSEQGLDAMRKAFDAIDQQSPHSWRRSTKLGA